MFIKIISNKKLLWELFFLKQSSINRNENYTYLYKTNNLFLVIYQTEAIRLPLLFSHILLEFLTIHKCSDEGSWRVGNIPRRRGKIFQARIFARTVTGRTLGEIRSNFTIVLIADAEGAKRHFIFQTLRQKDRGKKIFNIIGASA